MGNSNSVIDFEYKIAANDYKPQQKIKDQRLGELVQMRNTKTGHLVLMREKRFADSDTYNHKIEESVNQLTLKHHNLAKIYGFAGADAQEMFNNKYKIYIYFESLQDNLQRSITSRKIPLDVKNPALKTAGNFFSEAELLSIIHQLTDVLDYLQQNGVNHGEIKPENCYFSKDGTLKVFNQKLIHDDISPYEQAKQGNRRMFLTPIALEALKKKQSEPVEDKYRADVFSLGLTLLECATLKPSSQLYDWNNYTINRNTLSSRVMEIKERYSRNFCEIITEMISLQEDKRPDFRQLKLDLADRGRMSIASVYSHQSNDEKRQSIPYQDAQKIVKPQTNANPENFKSMDLKFNKINPSSASMQSLNTSAKPPIKSESIKTDKNTERVGRFGNKKFYQDENIEDDVGASEDNIKINKVLERAVHRSADKFKPSSLLNTEESSQKLKRIALGTATAQQEYQMDGPVTEKRPEQQTSIYGKLKDKFSKLRGASSQNNRMRDDSDERQPRRNENEISLHIKPKPAMPKPISTEISLETTDISIRSGARQVEVREHYTYEERKKQRTEFSVERLMQEAAKRSEKHQTSFNDPSDSSNYCQTEPGHETKERVFMDPSKLITQSTIKTRIVPPPLSHVQASTNSYGLPANFFAGAPMKTNVLKNPPLTPGSHASTVKRSTLDINIPINSPFTLLQSPSYATSQQSSVPISSYSSFAGNEMLKQSNKFQVSDLAYGLNETGKVTVDNVIKPSILTVKHDENKHFFPRKAFTPTVNVDIRTLQKPSRSATIQSDSNRKLRDENSARNEGPYSGLLTGKENENRENQNGPLRTIQKPNTYRGDPYSLTPKDSTNSVRPLGNHDSNTSYEANGKGRLSHGKNENEKIEDEIQKAIERSRKTYEFARTVALQLGETEAAKPPLPKAGSEVKPRYVL